ncbi:MAG: glucokinase [Rhodothalassiaceae bacterium]
MTKEETVGLVADIGGTNARFALVADGVRPHLVAQRRFACADHATLEAAVEAYLASVAPAQRPRRAVFAIAGPVDGDRVNMTNIAWHFSAREAARTLGFDRLQLVNDFTAIAHALHALAAEDMRPVPRGSRRSLRPGLTQAVLGPGTGLGISAIVREGARAAAIASEGGHVTFAPRDPIEREIEGVLRAQHGRVSYERLLSGPGLLSLYQALGRVEGRPAPLSRPADIVTAATDGSDALSRTSVLRFCAILGSFAGDLALAFGAWGGVFIAGGIVPRFPGLLDDSEFRARFEDKGRFAARLREVATVLVTHPDPGLFGAARILREDI